MSGKARVALIILLYLLITIPVLHTAFAADYPRLDYDGVLFQHAGWYMTQGGVLYRDVWDVKPPLAIETTALLSILTGGNLYRQHLLSVAMASLAAIGILLLIDHLVFQRTHSCIASLAAVLFLLTFPRFWIAPAYGFQPKHLMMVCGLLAVVLCKKHPFIAGALAALSAAYWQPGLYFAIAILFLNRVQWKRISAGGLLTALIVILPVILQGAGRQMIEQSILAHFQIGENQTVADRLWKAIPAWIYLLPVLPFALAGARKAPLWIAGGALCFAVQVSMDFDGQMDLMPLTVMLAVLFGIQTGNMRSLILIASVLMLVAVLRTDTRYGEAAMLESVPARHGQPSMAYIYWQKVRPESCHYRLSPMEIEWIERYGTGCE